MGGASRDRVRPRVVFAPCAGLLQPLSDTGRLISGGIQTCWEIWLASLMPGCSAPPSPAAGLPERQPRPTSEQDAHAIGVEAYLYFYPLVTMDLTRKQLTNVAKPEGFEAPMNAFASVPAFPTADMKVVVRPNFDTLYSSAWLDSEQGADDRLGPRYAWALLPAADAGHVDRRLRLARLAHDRNRRPATSP